MEKLNLPGSAKDMIKVNSSAAREWISKHRVQPWSEFVNTNQFRKPGSLGQWKKRIVKNVEHFQTNYIFVFTGLIIYSIITSPLLLLALGVFLGACYVINSRNEKIKILGHEITNAQQYGLAGALSFPIFFIAGAGAVAFWVLGVSFFLVGLHASFHKSSEEGTDEEEPFMEVV